MYIGSSVTKITEPITASVTSDVLDCGAKFWIFFANNPAEPQILQGGINGCKAVIIVSTDCKY